MLLSQAYARLGDLRRSQEQRDVALRLLDWERERERLFVRRNQRLTDPKARLALARHYRAGGRFSDAYLELQTAYSLAPQDAGIRLELKAFYQTVGVAPLEDAGGGMR
jgi:tetratricopeptide (TPR) repeat protein